MSSYQIYQFDGVTLPLYDQTQDLSTGAVETSLIQTVGGAFDWAGSRRRLPLRAAPTISGQYAAEVDGDRLVESAGNPIIESAGVYVVAHSAHADLRAQVDALKSKVGVRGLLVRRRFDNESVTQVRTARLLEVREKGETEERGVRAALDCIFEMAGAGWRSTAQSSVSLINNALVESAGTLPVRNATLTVTASTTITRIDVACDAQGVAWSWTGSLAAGTTLVVDAEALTVRAAGADAYSGFALGSGHTADGWLYLAPGPNVVMVSVTGAASAITLAWWDMWG